MARLAIRATGDRSKRYDITTGNEWVHITICKGNRDVYYVSSNGDGISVHRCADDKQLYYDIKEKKSETHSA